MYPLLGGGLGLVTHFQRAGCGKGKEVTLEWGDLADTSWPSGQSEHHRDESCQHQPGG